ncbi:MAG: hypothetical protein V4544_06595 [Pseudomonadota bacterium]
MNIPVTSYAHRIFPRMERYFKFGFSDKNYKDYPINLELNETPIGVYENTPNQIKGSIIITDKGLHYCVEDNYSKTVYYGDIEDKNISEDKLTVTVLDIYLKDGSIFYLPVNRNSKNSKFSDLFEIWHFLNNVTHELRKSKNTE